MAVVSSHLLSSTNGLHASGVKVIINQIKKNGSRRKIFQSKTDKNGRISKEFSLTKKDSSLNYEIIFNLQNYYKKKTNVTDIVIKFNMKDPKKKYHIPVIIAPNGYSVWWSK
tara:strand:+ start:720 stop:1055 length:336 start_codon:yes stop_codon:yes gene_type:complete